MAASPKKILKLRERYNVFVQDHPKVMPFLQDAGTNAIRENAIIEMKVISPEGKEYKCNIRVNADDGETLELIRNTK